MLVVICGIRKIIECIFTKRELRLLDDLLPESNKQRRRASHKPGSLRFRRKEKTVDDIEDPASSSRCSKKKRPVRHSNKRKREKTGVEVQDHDQASYSRKAIMLQPRSRSPSLPPYPKKDLLKQTSGRKVKETTDSTMSVHSKKEGRKHNQRSKSTRASNEPSSPQEYPRVKKRRASPSKKVPKCYIYVKLDSHKIFTPLHLEEKTVACLLKNLEIKFGVEEFEASKIDKIYQMNKKKFVFHLDDDMMEYVQSHEVFNIELAEVTTENETTKFNMTLMEME